MSQELRREFSFRDLILFQITAVITVRWISFAAARGTSSISLWAIAFVFFFFPLAYVVIDFTRKIPMEGGIYQWTKHSLGPFHGFFCAWAYVVNNLFYFPSLLIAVGGYVAFMVSGEDQSLQSNQKFALIFSLSSIWGILILNLIGLRFGKWVENIGGLSIWLPCTMLIVFGIVQFIRVGSATPFTWNGLFPDFGKTDTWTAWANICFAFTGIELASTMSEEVRDPERDLPRSIYWAGVIITCIYTLGTISVLIFLNPKELNLITGIMQAISKILDSVGLSFLTPFVSLLLALGGLGTLGAWLAGAARVPYTVGLDRYLPRSLAKLHPRWGSPYVSLLVLGVISSVIVVLSLAGASVKEAYLKLSNATIILYFIPFCYLFVSYIKANPAGKKRLAKLLAVFGLVSTVIAIVLACWPPSDTDFWRYERDVVGGSAALMLISLVFYYRGRKAITA
jgi:glutamate:GABA antiporter